MRPIGFEDVETLSALRTSPVLLKTAHKETTSLVLNATPSIKAGKLLS
jgi:hypothetical protein